MPHYLVRSGDMQKVVIAKDRDAACEQALREACLERLTVSPITTVGQIRIMDHFQVGTAPVLRRLSLFADDGRDGQDSGGPRD